MGENKEEREACYTDVLAEYQALIVGTSLKALDFSQVVNYDNNSSK